MIVVRLVLVFGLLALGVFCTRAQEARLTLVADTAISVTVYGERDGVLDKVTPIDTLEITLGDSMSYRVENIRNFSYLVLQYSTGLQCTLLLMPEDEILASYSNHSLQFDGSNWKGQYFINKYCVSGLGSLVRGYLDAWNKYVAQTIEFDSLVAAMQKDTLLQHTYFEGLDTLLTNREVTEKFASVVKEDLTLFSRAYQIQGLRTFLNLSKYKELVARDSVKIIDAVDSLYNLLPNADSTFIERVAKHYLGNNYLVQYYYHHFREGDGTQYDKQPFMNAPVNVRPGLVGRSLAVSIQYGTENDLKEQCQYFINSFPQSSYVALFKSYVGSTADNPNSGIIVIDPVFRLADLSKVEQLRGKYVFVDLWATWCVPCRKEFAFTSSLHKLIQSYSDVAMVYISLDKGGRMQKWTDLAEKYNLEGIHTIANDSLCEDIVHRVFNGQYASIAPQHFTVKKNIVEGSSITIPRYFLLDNRGQVIHCDLPRPSQMEELKKELDKVFGK